MVENHDLLSSFAFCSKGNSELYIWGGSTGSAVQKAFWCNSDFQLTFLLGLLALGLVTDSSHRLLLIFETVSALATVDCDGQYHYQPVQLV